MMVFPVMMATERYHHRSPERTCHGYFDRLSSKIFLKIFEGAGISGKYDHRCPPHVDGFLAETF
jgi:hypothetical protein